jgi:hypothetical protein
LDSEESIDVCETRGQISMAGRVSYRAFAVHRIYISMYWRAKQLMDYICFDSIISHSMYIHRYSIFGGKRKMLCTSFKNIFRKMPTFWLKLSWYEMIIIWVNSPERE